LDEQDSSGWGSRDGGQNAQDAYNPRLNYGPSNFDIRHMFKGDVVYQVPFGKGRTFMNRGGVLDAVLGGWQASTIFVLDSGKPFTPLIGIANSSGALSGQWYPNVIGNPNVSNPTLQQWFNACTLMPDGTTQPAGCTNPAWAIPAAGTFGNVGRNTLRGPGLIGVDFSMGKNFKLALPRETGELQIRIDAQNVLNHPNFELPNQSVGTGGAGIISSTTGDYSTTNNTYGARQIQLGARLSF
ncbi:MAG: carboxypeptidase regulatory-like domain-containing protein, partial [Acidobacteriaceae bacterium]|nr:carboxypeptidase regulatory-like domain-containing protein [Acidobacteriaceae bacterium]